MECCEDKVSGFGCAERHLGGFTITNLADENHIRVLAQAVFQSICEGDDIGANLTLCHQRISSLREDILNGLFDCDDAIATSMV